MALVTLRRVIAAATLCAAMFAGANAALADIQTYKDVLRPNGHARATAQKFVDFRACGYRKGTYVNDYWSARIDACMRARGWAIASVRLDPFELRERAHAAQRAQRSYQKYDQDGVWVTCHEIMGGAGEMCSNF
jgi:hypothetical protein